MFNNFLMITTLFTVLNKKLLRDSFILLFSVFLRNGLIFYKGHNFVIIVTVIMQGSPF